MANENQKQNSDEIFMLLVDAVMDYAIFALDTKGNILTWNKGAQRLKGYSEKEIQGQHFSKFYPPEDIRAKKPQMELELAEVTGRFEDEGWRLRKDGTKFWANVIITALKDKNGKLLGFSKVTRDLTERKIAEEHLKSAYAGLETRVKEKTSQLEEALRARDEFLSIASHELKTPITSIKMQIQMARHRLALHKEKPVDLEKQEQSLKVAENQLDRLTLLIDDLLNVAKIQAGKLYYIFEKVRFSTLLNEVLEGFEQQLVKSKNQIKLYVDEELEGYWDRTRIEQVLVNLISNASKYAPGSPIVIFAKQNENKAEITFQDLGPGIPREMRDKLFERFERLGQSRNVGGLGLGLFISKQVILAHGGKIEFRSGDEGRGATFIITLPLDSRTSPSASKLGQKPSEVFLD